MIRSSACGLNLRIDTIGSKENCHDQYHHHQAIDHVEEHLFRSTFVLENGNQCQKSSKGRQCREIPFGGRLNHFAIGIQITQHKCCQLPRISRAASGLGLAPKRSPNCNPHRHHDQKKKDGLNSLNHSFYFFAKKSPIPRFHKKRLNQNQGGSVSLWAMSTSKRYFLELSYHGADFHGWQSQKNAHSVQEAIESALSTYFRRPMTIMGSGRTDTGVHAAMQVCHFDSDIDFENERMIKAINGILPKSIAVHGIRHVIPDAHARFDAAERSYFYRVIFRKNPFLDPFAWVCFHSPDVERMNQAARYLLDHEDFECFSKIHTEVNHFRCQIKSAHWEQKEGELLFHITANRFLRGMVRAIVGTLMEIGLGKRQPDDMNLIIQSRERSKAGKAAPAKGLFLSKIIYPNDIYLD